MDDEVIDFINWLGRKNPKTVLELVHEEFPDADVSLKDIQTYLKTKGTDHVPKIKDRVYGKLFSNSHNAWQIDLMVDTHSTLGKYNKKAHRNDKSTTERYYLICINMNTKFLYVSKPVATKYAVNVVPVLLEFIKKFKPMIIYCDGENAFSNETIVNTLHDYDGNLKVFSEKQHLSLSIVDRIIRTIRDTRARMKIDKADKNDKSATNLLKVYTFNDKIMQRIVDTYNRTPHETTKYTPNQMMENPELEDLFIMKQIMKTEETIAKNEKAKLEVGDKVRYIPPSIKTDKKRFKLKAGYYIVYDTPSFFKYTIIAKDGSVLTVSRSELVNLDDKATGVEFGKTLRQDNNSNRTTLIGAGKKPSDEHDNFKPAVHKISYPVFKGNKLNGYMIEYPKFDKNGELDKFVIRKLTVRQLREKQPTSLHPAEVEYYKLHPDTYKVDGLKITITDKPQHMRNVKALGHSHVPSPSGITDHAKTN